MLLQERKVSGKKATLVMAALPPEPPPAPRRRRWPFVAAGLALLLALAAARRIHDRGEGGVTASPEDEARTVNVVRPTPAGPSELTLPVSLQPNQATDLYPRVDGFVKAWHAEIGARARAGEVLAEIDTPELDQEVARAEAQAKQAAADVQQSRAELEEARSEVELAEANVGRARANLAFAVSQAHRLRRLAGTGAASREENEGAVRERDARDADGRAAVADLARRKTALATRAATIRSREATLATAEATARRLKQLQSFKRIVAPFDGVVTKRSAEVGTLVSAGTSGNPRPLYRMAQAHVLRAQVAVPQAFAAQARAGDRASVTITERPGRAFPARVARTAGEIDAATRTVLVELELPNRDGALLPGTYAQVTFQGRPADGAFLVPSAAVLLRPDGPHVAVVVAGEAVLKKVEVGRDRGSLVEVVAGLTGREAVVANPTDDLRDGTRVEARAAKTVDPAPL